MAEQAVLAALCHTAERQHVVLRIAAVDPLETGILFILLVERRLRFVKMKQCLIITLQLPVLLIIVEQIPVECLIFIPLFVLAPLLSHKQKLLARMHGHQAVADTQIAELVFHVARHLIEHGFLQMNNFIMRQHENVALALRIGKAERDLILNILSEIRVALHVFEEIMHPAHVPFIGETEAVVVDVSGHLRPSRGFLRDRHHARIILVNDRIEMFDKFDCFEVFLASVFVRHPLAVLAAVIQVQHGSHRIHTQTVDVIFICPERRIRNQKIGDLVFRIVEAVGAPVAALTASRVRMLVQRRTIKTCEAEFILRKMCRHPVEDDADSMCMHIINKIHEILR